MCVSCTMVVFSCYVFYRRNRGSFGCLDLPERVDVTEAFPSNASEPHRVTCVVCLPVLLLDLQSLEN